MGWVISVNGPPECLENCLEAVVDWLKWSWLKLNPAKTEVLWLGRYAERHLQELPALDGMILTPVVSARSLGVILDSTLSMESQVSTATHMPFFHLRQARQLLQLTLRRAALESAPETPAGAKCGSSGPHRDPVESTYYTSALPAALAPDWRLNQV